MPRAIDRRRLRIGNIGRPDSEQAFDATDHAAHGAADHRTDRASGLVADIDPMLDAVGNSLRLRGKHKATFTPHMDDGDNIIVVNADKVVLTGRKREQKIYHHHTGYPGGIKERSAKAILDGRFPERVLEKAVERMLPRGPLGRVQLGNLRVYKGSEHPHAAQTPTPLDVAALNAKNSRSA